MTFLNVIILAVVQGLAELLPVSSSAHVVIAEKLLGLDPSSPPMTLLLVMLHTGTMFAVIVYFWKQWMNTYFKSMAAFKAIAVQVILATLLTGVVGAAPHGGPAGHPVPRCQAADTRADGRHGAGELRPGDQRQRPRGLVAAAHDQQVGEVHRRRGDVHRHLAGTGTRIGQLDHGKELGRPVAGQLGRPHHPSPSSAASASARRVGMCSVGHIRGAGS